MDERIKAQPSDQAGVPRRSSQQELQWRETETSVSAEMFTSNRSHCIDQKVSQRNVARAAKSKALEGTSVQPLPCLEKLEQKRVTLWPQPHLVQD